MPRPCGDPPRGQALPLSAVTPVLAGVEGGADRHPLQLDAPARLPARPAHDTPRGLLRGTWDVREK